MQPGIRVGSFCRRAGIEASGVKPGQTHLAPGLAMHSTSGVGVMKSFTREGGARIGWSNASIPWATLTADAQGLHLVAFGQRHSFPKDTLRSLSRHQGLFSVGLRIEHLREDCPKLVVFWVSLFPWSSRFEELRADLEGLGYRVRG